MLVLFSKCTPDQLASFKQNTQTQQSKIAYILNTVNKLNYNQMGVEIVKKHFKAFSATQPFIVFNSAMNELEIELNEVFDKKLTKLFTDLAKRNVKIFHSNEAELNNLVTDDLVAMRKNLKVLIDESFKGPRDTTIYKEYNDYKGKLCNTFRVS